MKKRFIESSDFGVPLAAISEEAARETSIRHGHPSTLHIWWARRPLASSRATTFAALLDVPSDLAMRKEIMELIKQISAWETVKKGNRVEIKQAQKLLYKQWGENAPRILDPFAGGGSIPLEALRLGCETYASDLNPVAVFIEKALLEWPRKFGGRIANPKRAEQHPSDELGKNNFLSYMVEKWATIITEEVKTEVGQFYPKDPDRSVPVGYLWARTIPCQNPTCETEIPLIRQFWLANTKTEKIAYKPIMNKETHRVEFVLQKGEEIDFDPTVGTIARSKAKCPLCGHVINQKEIQKLANKQKMGNRMIAIILLHPDTPGKRYRIATKRDIESYNEAGDYLQNKIKNWVGVDSSLPDEELPYLSGTFNVHVYGMTKWQDLFNARQKLALITFMDRIRENYERINTDCHTIRALGNGMDGDEAAKAVVGYLAIIFDRYAAYNTVLSRWHVTRSIITGFGRPALGMVWDYAESNPFSDSFSWKPQVRWVIRVIENNSWKAKEPLAIGHFSATSLPFPDNYFDAVLTDPPYYYNVPYADLSDFFYVWLKRIVGDLFPTLFTTPLTPKEIEIVQLAEKNEQKYAYKTKEFFEENLTQSFREITRVLKPGGIVVIVYTHKTAAGWETMLNSLLSAGLVVTASWPIHTEMKSRLRARASATLTASIYLVCRKLPREPVGVYTELQPVVKEQIHTKLQQFWAEGIVGGDFFTSAIGPAMETFSRYQRIEKHSGEAVTTIDLLNYIRDVSAHFIVSKLLNEVTSAALIDKESQFYLTYRWTYQDKAVALEETRKLASACGVNLAELWSKDGFVKKNRTKIIILGPTQRDEVKIPRNMVDVMHQAVLRWKYGKQDEIRELLTKTGYQTEPAFWQFCQAVAACLLPGKTEKRLLEGFLAHERI